MKRLLCALLCGLPMLSAQGQNVPLSVAGRVEHGPIEEMSGIVKSRGRDNLYWVHNDSGHEARIFAIDREGRVVIPTYSRFSYHGEHSEQGKKPWPGFKVLFTENVDWEDMAADGRFLYIADAGNNDNDRRDLGIYMISEIDPTASTQSAAIKRLPVRYPDQEGFPPERWHFDSESLFASAGKLYLITKHRGARWPHRAERGAKLYRLDTDYTDRDNVLTLVDRHPDILWATGADLSPDGRRLAVVSYDALWIFDQPARGDEWLSSTFTRIGLDRGQVRQIEAVTWENDSALLLTNEQRDMFRLALPAAKANDPRSGAEGA